MNFLCLDYGDKNIGLAIATSPLAEPLATFDIKIIFQKLPEFIHKYQIGELVVGNCPDDFLHKLQSFGLPVTQVDETLTTVDATKLLLHTTQTRRKQKIHEVSAALILQNYLDNA